MRTVTFLVLEGVDKGRVYKDLPIPVTIGREEGNGLRLNDERVSRFHAKVQIEDADIILTDLDSTNGARVTRCRSAAACCCSAPWKRSRRGRPPRPRPPTPADRCKRSGPTSWPPR